MPVEDNTGAGMTGGTQFGQPAYGESTSGSGAQGAPGAKLDQAKNKAYQLASRAREQASERVESGLTRGKNQAAITLSGVAETLRSSSQQLRERNEQAPGDYMEKAADQMEKLSNFLQNTEVEQIVDRVEQAARRQPALFIGGAFALGLLGARFLKSSRQRERSVALTEYSGSGGGEATRPTYGIERDVTGMRGAPAVEGPGAGSLFREPL